MEFFIEFTDYLQFNHKLFSIPVVYLQTNGENCAGLIQL